MEETEVGEVGVDKVGDEVREKLKEGMRHSWERWLALLTAIFAVLAAIAALKSGQLANESLLLMNQAAIKQTQASDQWAYYQAKGIKQTMRDATTDILTATQAPAETIERSRKEAERLKDQQNEIQTEAKRLEGEQKELQEESRHNLERHHSFAYAVTLLQVAIGLSAIAALAQRRDVWYVALVAGTIGIVFFTIGFVR